MTRRPAPTSIPDNLGEVARRHPGRVRTAVVGRHAVLLSSLDFVLTREGYDVRCVVAGEGTDPSTAAATAAATRPRIVVLSTGHDTDDAFRALPRLTACGARVVVLDETRSPARWGDHLRGGASAVVGLHEPVSHLLDVLARMRRGAPALDPAVAEALIAASLAESRHTRQARARLRLLTPRERAVLDLVAAGLSVREIAAREVVAVDTVRTQVKTILAKLEVSSQLAAVAVLHRVDEDGHIDRSGPQVLSG